MHFLTGIVWAAVKERKPAGPLLSVLGQVWSHRQAASPERPHVPWAQTAAQEKSEL